MATRLIYIAGPFRAGVHGSRDPRVQDSWAVQNNVMAAMGLALEVWKLGAVALCPHANTMFFQNAAGMPDDVWLRGDLAILERCDAVLLTSEWIRSAGARAEAEFADLNGIPVFETIEALKAWLA